MCVCVHIYLYIYLFIYLSICLFIYLYIFLFIYLFMFIFIFMFYIFIYMPLMLKGNGSNMPVGSPRRLIDWWERTCEWPHPGSHQSFCPSPEDQRPDSSRSLHLSPAPSAMWLWLKRDPLGTLDGHGWTIPTFVILCRPLQRVRDSQVIRADHVLTTCWPVFTDVRCMSICVAADAAVLRGHKVKSSRIHLHAFPVSHTKHWSKWWNSQLNLVNLPQFRIHNSNKTV